MKLSSKEPFLFLVAMSLDDVENILRNKLPSDAKTSVKKKKGELAEIRIQDGAWRGMILDVSLKQPQMQLLQVRPYLPTFGPKVIIFLASVVAISAILTVGVSISVGQFVPMVAGVGGLLGLMTYSLAEGLIVARIKSKWSAELDPILETLRSS